MSAGSDPRVAVGVRIRQLREQKGLSQEELGHRAGVDRTYVSSCERGRRNLSLLTLYRIAAALEVEPAALLSRDADEGSGA
jgi:transcriptional regulator with XRE-family HTH domain